MLLCNKIFLAQWIQRKDNVKFIGGEGGFLICTHCTDYLYVPKGAVPYGEKIKFTECEAPYIRQKLCETADQLPVAVVAKEYQQIPKKRFLKHVQIVTYYSILERAVTALTPADVSIRYSNDNGDLIAVEYDNSQSDVYYTIDNNNHCITIFTHHFTVYEGRGPSWLLFPYGSHKINLVADVYCMVSNQQLCVYVLDTLNNVKNFRKHTKSQENNNRRLLIREGACISELPEILKRDEEIECSVFLKLGNDKVSLISPKYYNRVVWLYMAFVL